MWRINLAEDIPAAFQKAEAIIEERYPVELHLRVGDSRQERHTKRISHEVADVVRDECLGEIERILDIQIVDMGDLFQY